MGSAGYFPSCLRLADWVYGEGSCRKCKKLTPGGQRNGRKIGMYVPMLCFIPMLWTKGSLFFFYIYVVVDFQYLPIDVIFQRHFYFTYIRLLFTVSFKCILPNHLLGVLVLFLPLDISLSFLLAFLSAISDARARRQGNVHKGNVRNATDMSVMVSFSDTTDFSILESCLEHEQTRVQALF